MKHLPQEIIDEIIDAVASERDVRTLRACALTCISWVPRTRRHFFSTITLTEPSTVRAFVSRLHSPPPRIRLRPNLLPPVGHLVRHLRLGVPIAPNSQQDGGRYAFSFYTIEDINPSLMPNLTTLSIAEIPEPHFYASAIQWLYQGFKSVKTLRLSKGILAPETLTRILGGFPRLSSLQLTYPEAYRDRVGIRLIGEGIPRVRLRHGVQHLVLGVPDLPIVEWLVQQGGLARTQLTSLSLLFQPQDDLHAVQAMLHHCSRTLTELSIGYADPPYVLPIEGSLKGRKEFVQSAQDLFKYSSLKTNTSLRTLRIEGCEAIEHTRSTRHELHSWIPALLQQIRSGRLETVTLSFRCLRQIDSSRLSWIDWAAVDTLLATGPLKFVRRVEVEVEKSEIQRGQLLQQVAALLPLVTRRGSLRVRVLEECPSSQWEREPISELQYMTLMDCVDPPVHQGTGSTVYAEEYEYYQNLRMEMDCT
ncbi:hypothetical protein ONZ51_g6054 [Trametes cubensis]|uniref:F-box domain-containing protein n=1 Tax=Trametes cubensis TaxID=1111947 RepID=A0AAD7XD16_9APHY|nr:hypothetical protein ONZ51_g6054 [Trametes cubensis]